MTSTVFPTTTLDATRLLGELEALVANRTSQLEQAMQRLEEDIRKREAAEAELLRRNNELTELNARLSMAQDLGDIPSVVHVANAIVHALDLAGQPEELVPVIAQTAWDSLRIDSAGLRRVFAETESEFENACQILTASN